MAEKKYKNPPLVEAIYEVYVKDSPGWSELSYARIREKLAARFDGEVEKLEPVGVHVQFGPGKTVAQALAPEPPRHRFWMKDRGEMFQYGPPMCAYNLLSRYRQFEVHAPDLEQLLLVYLEESKPTEVAWAGQRYINKIPVPVADPDPASYFHFYPRLTQATAHRPFALQVVTEVFEGGEVTLNLAYQGEEQGNAIYFLDIYARSTTALPPKAAELRTWQERAHEPVRRSFESALTEKSRQLFEGAKT